MWLEDLFVRPSHRREGVGRALLAAVAARVRERGGERLEWAALDWNELALGFYRGSARATMASGSPTAWTARRWRGWQSDGRRKSPIALRCPSRRRWVRALVVQWIRRPPPKR